MPRPARVPAYCLHKPSGQASVILDGRHVYLGPYGSAESREKYSRLMWGRFAIGAKPDEPPRDNENPCASLSVNELFVQYLRYATGYYVKDGKPTRELSNIKDAMRAVRALYGHSVASSFGPK